MIKKWLHLGMNEPILSNHRTLEFFISVADPKNAKFSLEKKDSDFSDNQLILNALVGTLVKYAPSGRIEPYLAESWFVDSDKKNWEFKIRSGLKAQNGVLLDAALYKELLESNLKEIAKNGGLMVFDHLVGWQDFILNKSRHIAGLEISEANKIKMRFLTSPGDLLEVLRMPLFGFWLERNGELVSTGPYQVAANLGNKVTLLLRPGWFSSIPDALKSVTIAFSNFSFLSKDGVAITKVPFYYKEVPIPEGYWVRSPPTRFEGFVLSPFKNGFFKELGNRQVFLKRIRELYPKEIKSRYLYPATPSKSEQELPDIKYNGKPGKLTFALERLVYSPEEISRFEAILNYVLRDSGQSFEFIHRNPDDKTYFEKVDSNTFFDARITSVDIGAAPLLPALKMMFCTKIGVNFPDPEGRICEMVESKIALQQPIDLNFIEEMNQAIFANASVIPITHHSEHWFVTNAISPRSLAPTTLYPQFDRIEVVKS